MLELPQALFADALLLSAGPTLPKAVLAPSVMDRRLKVEVKMIPSTDGQHQGASLTYDWGTMVHYGNLSQPNHLFDLRSLEVVALFYSKDAEFYLKTYSLFSL